jgi:hypothetical protein
MRVRIGSASPLLIVFVFALVFAAVLGWSSVSDARASKSWSYAELFDKADVVVIASPGKTTITRTTQKIPNMSIEGWRVGTELNVVAVLKGKAPKAITLHHITLKDGGMMPNGPGLVRFDPKADTQYLMFLVKDTDGEYIAVSGQTDPAYSLEPVRARP